MGIKPYPVIQWTIVMSGAAYGRKPTTEKVKIVFSKWSLVGQKRNFIF